MAINVLGVIPARYASTRFPGKPLAMINGRSMIQRVYEKARMCQSLSRLIVATDDSRISEHVKSFGGEVMFTSPNHRSGTERLGEVLELLKLSAESDYYQVVVNIQGDEPFLNPRQIELAIACFEDGSVQISSLMKKITDPEALFNPNVVKVIVDLGSDALYFSRSAIPFLRDVPKEVWTSTERFHKHIGLYAYRTGVLRDLLKLSVTPLEMAESLEQLRWLENGFKIRMVLTEHETISVDTPEDLLKLTNNI